MKRFSAALVVVLLEAGCATSSPSFSATASSPAEQRGSDRLTRCSSADPDRDAWFCVIGQIVYAALSMLQTDAGRLR